MSHNHSTNDQMQYAPTRRGFFRDVTLGAAGIALGAGMLPRSASAIPQAPKKSKVSFVTGDDRHDMVIRVLKPFEKEIAEGIQDKQVVIKVNMAAAYDPLTATHPDAVRGLLDFLAPIYNKKIILAESTAGEDDIQKLFDHYGYASIRKEYNVKIIQLNDEPTVPYLILGKHLEPLQIPLISTFLDPNNYIFSITRPKTHNGCVITLGLKNTVMGSPLKVYKKVSYKGMMHGNGPWWLNYNIYLVAQSVRPNFTVIDGLVGLEGEGPTSGEPVDQHIALAGPDVIAVDRITTDLMGVDIADVGYLNYCGIGGLGNIDRTKIQIIGSEDPMKYIHKYKMHSKVEEHLMWKKNLPIKM